MQLLTVNSFSFSNNLDSSRRVLWLEILGFFIIGVGLFLTLCLFGYDPGDMALMGKSGKPLNWGGPVGVYLAHGLRSTLGLASFLVPTGMVFWGVLFARGKVTKPERQYLISYVALMVLGAATLHVFFPNSVHSYGNGGHIGGFVGGGAMSFLGFAGALLFIAFATVATLISTRYVSFRKLPEAESPIQFDETDSRTKKSGKVDKKKTTPTKKAKDEKTEDDVEDEPAPVTVHGEFTIDLGPAAKAPPKPDMKIFKSKPIAISKGSDETATMELLTEKLAEFKVSGEVTNVTQGPVVKTYEYEPSAGTKVSKIESLQSDLARLLKAESLRVVPVPGSTTVGFEIPNAERSNIHFGNIANTAKFKSKEMALPIAMGVDCFGKPVIEDLAEMPHLLVAGATGSGKSVFINTLITSLLARNTAKELRMVLIDPKMVELGSFNGTAHMACPVVTDIVKDGLPLLERLVFEMEERYNKLKIVGAKNIQAFNQTIKTKKKGQFKKFTGKWQAMPHVVVVVDEFADMMMSLGKEAEQYIARLAQKARAAGIHMVIATQRPSVKVVTGLIKANFPTRIGFRVTSAVDSRTILDQSGAETLLGKGDMLYLSTKGVVRLHGGFLSEEEINKVVRASKPKRFAA